jgi:hypothetical protein
LCVGDSGLETLARRPGIAGEFGVTRVIERGAKALGLGAVERGAGLIDGVALLDRTLVDRTDRCLRRRDRRLVLGDGGTVVSVIDCKERLACLDPITGHDVDSGDHAAPLDSERDDLARWLDNAGAHDILFIGASRGGDRRQRHFAGSVLGGD